MSCVFLHHLRQRKCLLVSCRIHCNNEHAALLRCTVPWPRHGAISQGQGVVISAPTEAPVTPAQALAVSSEPRSQSEKQQQNCGTHTAYNIDVLARGKTRFFGGASGAHFLNKKCEPRAKSGLIRGKKRPREPSFSLYWKIPHGNSSEN